MNKAHKIQILTWVMVFAYFGLMIHQSDLLPKIEAASKMKEIRLAQADKITTDAWRAIAATKKHIQKETYTVKEYVADLHKLVQARHELREINSIASPALGTQSVLRHIDSTIKVAVEKAKEPYYHNNGEPVWGLSFFRDFNMAEEAWRNKGKISSLGFQDAILGIFKWYTIFMFFALAIYLVRIFYDANRSLKEELLLAPKNLLVATAAWPLGLCYFPEHNAVLERCQRFLYKINPNKAWDEKFTPEEKARAMEMARRPIQKFDDTITELENLPENIAISGRKAVTITSFVGTIISPLVAHAGDMLLGSISGTKDGTGISLKYAHYEKYWQTNLNFKEGGDNISLLGGPVMTFGNFSLKPEIGPKLNTNEEFGVDTGIGGIALGYSPDEVPVNFWSLNKYFLNFRDKLKHKIASETAAHFMLGKLKAPFLGLGAGFCGALFPFLDKEKFRPPSGHGLYSRPRRKSCSNLVSIWIQKNKWTLPGFISTRSLPFKLSTNYKRSISVLRFFVICYVPARIASAKRCRRVTCSM